MDALHIILGNEIHFEITDTLFPETLLLKIRTKDLKFTSNSKEKNLNKKKTLCKEIRNHRLKGHMIRSRTKWLDEGEKPTKYFCVLETKNYVNKTIKKLKVNDSIITDQDKIMEET